MLPIIDFSDFRVGDARRRRAVAAEVGAILEEIGFFYIRGHGIAEATIQAARSAIETFFACSEAEKRAYQRRPRRYRGYLPPIPFNEASATEARAPILYEAFILGPDVTRDDPTVAASRGLVSPTPWPVEPLTFRAAVTTYRDAVDHLALALLRAFALSLDAPEEAIVRHFRQPLTNTSLLHYLPRPIVDGGEDGGADDVPAHRDTNAVTIVAPGEVGGLEVRHRDGRWIDAEPVPGCFVVNIGTMMECWSGGRYRSTMHRVRPPLATDRYSIAHFATPDYDTTVEPLPGVRFAGSSPAPIHAGHSFAAFVSRFDAPS